MSLSATARFTPRGDLGRFVSARVTPAVTASVEAAGALIEQSAKLYCPVDTGELQGSITTEIIPTDSSVRSATAPHTSYAAYVEFGTGQRGAESPGAGDGPYSPNWPGMVAQPYMRPAVDETRETIADLFRSQLSLALAS